MIVSIESNDTTWDRPGERLIKILDTIGFPEGYGRMIKLQELLMEKKPETFSTLSYSTVKAWFSDRAPAMSRIDEIFDVLGQTYSFPCDIRLIKSWWKVGGFNPFENMPKPIEAGDISTKLEIKLSTLISAEMGDSFADVSTDDLKKIKMVALNVLAKFADPKHVEPDDQTLALIVKGIINS